ncbi:MAG TPA: hypothetical protein DEP72_07490 [Clostridiales bacterium]|nr:MAG: hypothetical protein A2Y18_06845 [Clostridiales bacterium GWD2_32_19]HCC07978.1 hypothetical protein [Clostridiales bacterium]
MDKIYIDIISWSGTILSILGQVLINRKQVSAYYYWIIGCLLWGIIGIVTKNYALLTMYVIYLGLDVEGLYHWKKLAKKIRRRKVKHAKDNLN